MIERRPFGRTGHQSTVTLFGAAALARASQDEADRALEVLLRYGVNHIDTAARYGDSELRIGAWMPRHRADFFLATKTGSRTAREAREDIHRSLERLRVDQLDLIQLHSLAHPDDWDQALGPGGALEAAIQAREERLVDVAERAGDSTQYLSEVERGLKDPSSERLQAITGALDLTVRQLASRAMRSGDVLAMAA